MWILPSNLQLSSPCVPEYVDSREELKKHWEESSELPLMWRSKPLLLPTFWRVWKRAYWMQHLSGRILKRSMQDHFVEKYMASLEDIHVSHSLLQESGREQVIQDTFTRLLVVALKNRGLYGVSLKMSRATYHSVSTLYKRTYERWVTRLRLESIQRKKPVHLIEGTGSLFSHWKTPSASECEGGQLKFKPQQNQNVKYKLRDQVSWPTPDTTDTDFCEGVALKGNRRKGPKNFYQAVNWSTPVSSRAPRASEGYYPNLVEQAKSWGTPTTRDYKDGAAESVANVPENGLLGRMDLPTQQSILNAGQQDQVKTNTIGKSRASLNPAWVAQLMGTTSEKIFFVHSVTAWLNKPQNLLSSTSSKNTESA
jgi:hypothetical protein